MKATLYREAARQAKNKRLKLSLYLPILPNGFFNVRPRLKRSTMHEPITLTTPALLFSAISLILLAYTNRFMGYATLIRTLHEKFKTDPNELLKGQIANIRKRLYLTKNMQIAGVTSLFLCVGTMFLIFVGEQQTAIWLFGIALIMMIASLGISIYEIQISVKALDLHLSDMEEVASEAKDE